MSPINKCHCGVGILVVYTTLTLVIVLTNSHQTQANLSNQAQKEPIVAPDSLPTTQPSNSTASIATTAAPKNDTSTTTSTTTTTTTTAAAATSSSSSSTTTTTTTTTTTPKPKNLNCPSKCSCTATKVNCEGKQLTLVPKFDLKNCPFVEFRFANNSLTSIDFKQFPMATIELLDLSDNDIQSIVPLKKRSKENELTKLKVLDVSQNKLDSLGTLFSPWKMPALETLNLADNPIDKLNASDFSMIPSLKSLNLSRMTQLLAIDETSFAPLAKLQSLNLSKSVENFHLPDQLFAHNSALETLDLSYNDLIEVPAALRGTPSIKYLYLDGNSMTSLRQSDFINRRKLKLLQVRYCGQLLRVEPGTFAETTALKTLIISNNKRFIDFSVDSFRAIGVDSSSADKSIPTEITLELLDLSANNLTSMPNLFETLAPALISNLRLVDNPWDCTCSLEWMVRQPSLLGSQPIHCASPDKFKDIELSQYFQMVDCQVEASTTQKFVLVMFILFLIVLTVAVFVQRVDICQRLQWRDQYGTIYYTKASFPTEQV